jgi:alginate O-acetyltransferase complex protein AlgI
MLFNSYQFAVFFLLVTAVYFAAPHRIRPGWLLVASCYFYMVFIPKYILALFLLILVDYAAGLMLENASTISRKKLILVFSLVSNIGILGLFKYFNLVSAQFGGLLSAFGAEVHSPRLSWVLPIGLSFHTFQSMSYTIEVYRGTQSAERNLGRYALYVLLFPQMVAGPIERPQNLLPQLRKKVAFDYARVTSGLKLMLWGLFKKVVIADNLALLVTPAYQNPEVYQGWPLITATYAFAIQIFCDFSGYSDIARGAARVLGFELMENFNLPYYASSISEFWKRWHISLSTWFRDYVYIPLGGNRAGQNRILVNILVVFLLSGLWHGADLVFLFWGGLHGLYLIMGLLTRDWRQRLAERTGLASTPKIRIFLGQIITFHLVSFAWIFFRAGSLATAFEVIRNLFPFNNSRLAFHPLGLFEVLGVALGLAIMALIHRLQSRNGLRELSESLPAFARWTIYAAGAGFILLWGQFRSQDFIYFQF